jgi:glycine/D-amino acid oxidase-like deaminating enzyme
MSSTATKHVAIIGGGILGVSTAVHLLREGASVTLLTERGLASEATGRSLSWLNSAGERSTPYHQLRLAGVDRYRTLFAADPSREWLQFGGGLMWNAAGQREITEARQSAMTQSCSRRTALRRSHPALIRAPFLRMPSSTRARAGSACRTWWTS